MAVVLKLEAKSLVADKETLRRILEEQDRKTGFIPDPAMTPQKVCEMMLADGIRSEDNAFSREIIQMREE